MKSHRNWQSQTKEWGMRIGILVAAGLWLVLVGASWADAAEDRSPSSETKEASSDDEYSFKWLDPDKKIYVLQNRRYTKARHLLLSAMGGVGTSNPYRRTYSVDPRVAYYLSESFGIEGFFTASINNENNPFRALQNAAPNTLPVVREINAQYGLLAHYVPWYAKINVFNSILYFDWYFSGGAGQLSSSLDTRRSISSPANYVDENLFAIFAGTGHQYYLSERFIVRMDVTGAFYQAPIFGTTGESTWYSNFNFGIGLGLRL